MSSSVANGVGAENDEDGWDLILDIDQLQNHGIGATDIAKLKANGYYTVAEVHSTTRKALMKVKGFSEIKVEKVKEACVKCMPSASEFMTAADYGDIREKVHTISTGSAQWDAILGGGIKSMSITEVYGEFRCGKTQLAQTLCVSAQLPKERGGASGKVAYIDTEGAFRPERIAQIAVRFGVDPGEAMQNVVFARCYNSEKQHELLYEISEKFAGGQYRLLIIDSIIACFRNDYNGRGELQERQSKLGSIMNKLNILASHYNIAVLITNQVMSDPGASALFAGADGRKAAGGHVLAHASQTRILLRKGRGDERVAKIIDSPDVPERDATYIITSGGIADPEKA